MEINIFYEIWVLHFFSTLHKSVVETRHPSVITSLTQEVRWRCQMLRTRETSEKVRVEKEMAAVVLPTLSISTPGELAKSEVSQVTFPEIPISLTSGSGNQKLFFLVLH